MSAYCTAADLVKVFADIASYDRKITLPEYDFTTYAANIYQLTDAGSVAQLYIDGAVGTQETSIAVLLAHGHWYYDATADTLYVYLDATPTSYRIQAAPETWETAVTNAITDASDYLESLLDIRYPRPIPKTDGAYDYAIVRATALLACVDLVQATDPQAPVLPGLREQLWNDTGTGLLDRLGRGEIKLGWELTASDAGQIAGRVLSTGTTGYPTAPQGIGTTEYDQEIIEIVTGATITAGTENTTVTYRTRNLQGEELVAETLITGYHQTTGLMDVRFVPGKYTAGDTWTLTSTAHDPGTGSVRQIEVTRCAGDYGGHLRRCRRYSPTGCRCR